MDDVAGTPDAAEISIPTNYTQAVEAFRAANERIHAAASRLHIKCALPFVCECGRPGCTAVVHLHLDDFERVRASASLFLVARGHERDVPGARPTREVEDAVVVEAVGVGAGRPRRD